MGKIDNFEYLTGKEILSSNQQQIIEQAKFTYSPLGNAFEKQRKTIEDQGQKQVEALKSLKSDTKKQQLRMWFLEAHWIMMKLTKSLLKLKK